MQTLIVIQVTSHTIIPFTGFHIDTFKYTQTDIPIYCILTLFFHNLLAKIAQVLYHIHIRTLKKFGNNIITVQASKTNQQIKHEQKP